MVYLGQVSLDVYICARRRSVAVQIMGEWKKGRTIRSGSEYYYSSVHVPSLVMIGYL